MHVVDKTCGHLRVLLKYASTVGVSHVLHLKSESHATSACTPVFMDWNKFRSIFNFLNLVHSFSL